MVKGKRTSLSVIISIIVLLVVIAICLINISRWQQTISANDEAISALHEEASSLTEEIEEYSYKTGMSKEDFVEEEARERGYVYPDETEYYNVTPGA